MVYAIEYAEAAEADLQRLRSYDRAPILDRIDAELSYQPLVTTRHKKMLPNLLPPWEHIPPLRQLRVGDHRVFYDVDEPAQVVVIRAVRHKPPHKTTEEVL